MKQNKFPSQFISFIVAITLTIVINSCGPSVPETETKTANDYIYEKFQDWYLWYDQIPDIDPNGIKTQEALIDSIKYPRIAGAFLLPLLQSRNYSREVNIPVLGEQ